jgi:hypothetical protein
MNRGQDDKEPIEDKMRDDHLYRVLEKDTWMIDIVKPRIFIENPNPCTIAIVPGSVAIAYRTSHR